MKELILPTTVNSWDGSKTSVGANEVICREDRYFYVLYERLCLYVCMYAILLFFGICTEPFAAY